MPDSYPFRHRFDPSRYSEAYQLACVPEEDVQKAGLQALHTLGIVAWGLDVGGKKLRGRAWGALRRAGVQDPAHLLRAKHPGATDGVQGFPDVVGILPGGRALLIEVKAPRWLKPGARKALVVKEEAGEPTPEQLRILMEAHRQGAIVGIAWSTADFIEIAKLGLRDVAHGL